MTVPLVSDRDYCLFHRFWSFEYCKRNPEFVHAVTTFFATNEFSEKQKHKTWLERHGYFGWISDYSRYINNKCDLLGIALGIVQPKYPKNALYSCDGLYVHEYKGCDKTYKSLSCFPLRAYNGIATINFSEPLENLIEDLKHEYKHYHGMVCNSIGVNLGLPDDEREYASERCNIRKRSKASFEVDHRPRAIGLWLWDHAWGLGWPRQRGAIARAIQSLRSELGTEKLGELGYGNSDQTVFNRLHRKTSACIKACEVLSLK